MSVTFPPPVFLVILFTECFLQDFSLPFIGVRSFLVYGEVSYECIHYCNNVLGIISGIYSNT